MRRILLILIAFSGWFALGAQYYLILKNSELSFVNTTINFFSFFTILTNLLVAVCVTMLLRGTWKNHNTLAAIAVYITIVGVVYNLVLRSIWNPQGLQKIVDELLHSVNPVLFVIFWIAFVPKDRLKWKDAFRWLVYPLVYSVYTLIHGLITDWYPYPFIDLTDVGWTGVAINSMFILIAFLVVSLIVIGFAHVSRGVKEA